MIDYDLYSFLSEQIIIIFMPFIPTEMYETNLAFVDIKQYYKTLLQKEPPCGKTLQESHRNKWN